MDQPYEARVANERLIYRDNQQVHDLPPIAHYWSHTYVHPRLVALGLDGEIDLFRQGLERQCAARPDEFQRFASVGAGNCDVEIGLAAYLRSKGYTRFVIDCVELNPAMLERGARAAAEQGVTGSIELVQADFNEWVPAHDYDAVVANQSLHHVLKLEGLFQRIHTSLKPAGQFLVSDMIGRNGHLRWPEALEVVWEFWRRLPPSYRFNRQLRRYEEMFQDWDCSRESFEGIRSQDVLPLLLEHFHFHLFYGFANAVDPFVDRSFGFHFDAGAAWDRAFIDEVHRRDEQEIRAGRLKPTHMMAVLGKLPPAALICHEPLRPEFCVRQPDNLAEVPQPEGDPYEWQAWPHNPAGEVALARRLQETRNTVETLRCELDRVNRLFEERSAWALELDRKYAADVGARTEWAQRLDRELEVARIELERINSELEKRTAWALQMDGELRRLEWARRLARYGRKLRRPIS